MRANKKMFQASPEKKKVLLGMCLLSQITVIKI